MHRRVATVADRLAQYNAGDTGDLTTDIQFFESRAKNLTEAADRNWEAFLSARPHQLATPVDIEDFKEQQARLLLHIEHQRDQAQTAALLATLYELRRQGKR